LDGDLLILVKDYVFPISVGIKQRQSRR